MRQRECDRDRERERQRGREGEGKNEQHGERSGERVKKERETRGEKEG